METKKFTVSMDEKQIKYFLDKSFIMRLSTLNKDGTIHSVPMWFVIINQKIHFLTHKKSRKTLNIRKRGNVTCLFDSGDEYATLRGFTMIGTAIEIDDRDILKKVRQKSLRKYFGLGHPHYSGYKNFDVKNFTVFKIETKKIFSWDYRRNYLPFRS